MDRRSMELEHLAQAERHIAEASQRIAEMTERAAMLESDGYDAGHARDLLKIFQETLRLLIAHRDMILRELGRISN